MKRHIFTEEKDSHIARLFTGYFERTNIIDNTEGIISMLISYRIVLL